MSIESTVAHMRAITDRVRGRTRRFAVWLTARECEETKVAASDLTDLVPLIDLHALRHDTPVPPEEPEHQTSDAVGRAAER